MDVATAVFSIRMPCAHMPRGILFRRNTLLTAIEGRALMSAKRFPREVPTRIFECTDLVFVRWRQQSFTALAAPLVAKFAAEFSPITGMPEIAACL
jgi:hypothetical protein